MTFRLRLPRRRTGVVLLLLGGFLVAAAALQPWWLGPWVAHRLSASSGRSVHFDSFWVGLTAALEPVVHCRGVRIDNAAWADTSRPFAALGEMVAVFSWRSVAERRPVIARLVLRDGEVDLERQADGLRNWRLANPEDRGPGRYKVLSLQPERATVRFVHRGVDLEFVAASTPGVLAAADPAAKPAEVQLGFKGLWRGVPFTASLATDAVLTFFETGRMFGLRGHVASSGARLEVDGRAGDILRAPSIEARVVFTGASLAPFAAFIGPRYSAAKAIRVEGELKAADDAYALTAARGRVGASDLAGDASLAFRDKRRVIRLDVSSESTDLDDLLWLAGRSLEPRRTAPGAAAAAASAPADAQVEVKRVPDVDVDLSFEARRLHAARYPPLQSLKVQAALTAGRLTVPTLDVGIAGGHAAGRLALDLLAQPATAEADVTLQGLRLEALMRGPADAKRIAGNLQGRAQLMAAGDSAAALLASAAGTVTATLKGGTISSRLDAEMGLQGGKILRSMVGGDEPIPIRCGAAAVDVQRGRGRVRSLVIDTARTRTTATGTIDLAARTIDLVLTPEAKQGGLFVLNRSIRLHGPLLKPEHSLVDRAAPASAAACAG